MKGEPEERVESGGVASAPLDSSGSSESLSEPDMLERSPEEEEEKEWKVDGGGGSGDSGEEGNDFQS